VNRPSWSTITWETLESTIFAGAKCVEHKRNVYGLVGAPSSRGKCRRNHHGKQGARVQGWKPRQLKVMGVDVFSRANFRKNARHRDVRTKIGHGVYKKLLIRNNRLMGVVLVGRGR